MMKCEWCSTEFERTSNQGRKPRYCSPAHRQEAYQARRRSQAAGAATDIGMEALAHGGLDDFARATAIFEEVVAAMPSKQMAALAGAIDLRGITGMRETLANLALTAIDTSALASMQNAFVKVDASALSSFTGIENVFAAIDAPR